jgi:hypothetical protein
VAVAAQKIGTKLVGDEQEEVRTFWHAVSPAKGVILLSG